MKLISFCIFGNAKKYRKGLLANIEIINKNLPAYCIRIIVGNDVEEEYIKTLTQLYDKITNLRIKLFNKFKIFVFI